MVTLPAVLDQVRDEARTLRPGRAALTLVATPLFAAGWLAARAAGALWVVLAWSWAAVLVGWRTAHESRSR